METKSADLSSLRIDRNKQHETSFSAKKTGKILFYLFIILIVFIAGYYGYKSIFASDIEVKLTTAVLRTSSESSAILTASGYVVAQRKASVASKGTGRLLYLGVVEGDQVKKDQIIARLEDNDIKAQLSQAKANLKLSEAELKVTEQRLHRQKELLKTNSTTQEELEAADANYLRVLANIELAKAGVEAAEVNLENMLIRAPFDGTVLTKNADVGEIVAPFAASASSKAAVVTMADMKSLQVEADVSESNIERIVIDQECEISLDAYPEKRYPGYVAKIVPTADRSKATVQVKVGFRKYDSSVLPEMSAKVSFLTKGEKVSEVEEKPALVIPSSSVIQKSGRFVVYLVKDNKAVEVAISTGKKIGEYIEVTSGLNNGDQVIEVVEEKIQNGTKVKVL